jgi:tetratricopeptide (TPR) repeat protein
LGHLPLALIHAAGSIRDLRQADPHFGYAAYRALFAQYRLKIFDEQTSASTPPMAPARNVRTTWEITLARLDDENHGARQLLTLAAFFASEGIRLEWFEKGRACLPPPLREYLADDLRRDALRRDLARFFLITGGENGFGVHRLLQEAIRDSLPDEKQAEWVGGCVSVLKACAFSDFSTAEARAAFQALVPHVEAVTKWRETLESNEPVTKPEETAALYDFLGRGFIDLAQYSKVLKAYEKALVIQEKVPGKDHPDTATTYHNIATMHDELGQSEKALEGYRKALDIQEKALGKDHPSAATIYNNIAEVYYKQCRYEEALKWYRKALDIGEKGPGKDHPDTVAIHHNLAVMYDEQGQYEEALKCHRKALAILEKALGKDHPDTAQTCNNIAGVYYKQGQYEKTLKWHRKALGIQEKVLGKDRPDTATTYNNIAVVYYRRGQYAEALEEFLKAHRIRIRKLGETHPYTQVTLRNMETAYPETRNPKPFPVWLAEALRRADD